MLYCFISPYYFIDLDIIILIQFFFSIDINSASNSILLELNIIQPNFKNSKNYKQKKFAIKNNCIYYVQILLLILNYNIYILL